MGLVRATSNKQIREVQEKRWLMYPDYEIPDILSTLIEHGLKITCFLANNQTQDNGNQVNQVVFSLGNVYYGLPVEQVCTIQSLGCYTPLPFVHRCIVGFISINHNIPLLVMDLRLLVDMVPIKRHPNGELLVVTLQDREIGLLVEGFFAPQNSN